MPRLPIPPRLLAGAALVLHWASLAAAGTRFEALPAAAHWVVLGIAAVVLALSLRRGASGARSLRGATVALAGASLLAAGLRISLARALPPPLQAPARAADRADGFLADLTREIGDAAYLLARIPALAAAVEGSDASDTRARAFRALSEWTLPGTGIARASATLYDAGLRPVAWSGAGPDLSAALAGAFPNGVRDEDCPDPAFPLFLYAEDGRRGTLVAAECTRNRLGLVTVEAALAESPPPASGAAPASALELAAGRGLEARFLEEAGSDEALAQLFEREGDRFVSGPAGARHYSLALRAYDGQLLGSANTALAPEAARRAERRTRAAFFASLLLLGGALAALPGLLGIGVAGAGAAIWTVGFGLLASLAAFGGDSGSLSGGAGAPFGSGCFESPLAAVVLMAAGFGSVRIVGPPLRRALARGAPTAALGSGRGAGAGAAALAATALVVLVGQSGASPLASASTAGAGFPEVLAWAALLLGFSGLLQLAAILIRPRIPVLLGALATVAACALLLWRWWPLFALIPLVGLALAAGSRFGRLALRAVRQPLSAHDPAFAFVVAFLAFVVPTVVLYPAMAWIEEDARWRYATDAAPVQVVRHRFAVCHALEEAARRIDAEAPRYAAFDGEIAYRLWLETGLPRLTAASALEVLGPAGRRSRFGVGFPRRPDPRPSDPAPTDWSEAAGCEAGADENRATETGPASETVLEIRRRLPSGLAVTLRAAVRETEIPFLPRAAGIADHFLARSEAAPAVFRGRDLRLEPDPGGEPRPGASERAGVRIAGTDPPLRVSWNRSGSGTHLAALLGFVFLAALAALLVALAARLGRLFPGASGRLRRRSFQMQLTEALAAAVLAAIIAVALLARTGLGALLEAEAERETLALSRSVERVARELGALDPDLPAAELVSRLAHAADQLDTDAALYQGGRLLGVSRPELARTGLLPPRPPRAATLAATDPASAAESLAGGAPVFHFEAVGRFRYRTVWTRLVAPPRPGSPLLLAVPLPAREAERIGSVRVMQHTLLLGSGSVALVLVVLLPPLLARRLAAPVRALARATGRIADGDLEAPVPTHRTLTELRLLAASVERLVRRIPGVRRRMREEAAADLARRVAHDIKNALAPIGLAADYIRRVLRDPRGRNPTDAVEESVTDILDQVERLRRISSEFSALGAPLALETVDLAALVRATSAPYRRSEAFRVTVEARGRLLLRADPEIIARVVENLLQNAVEATADRPGSGDIRVRAHAVPDSSSLRIEVEDDGPGVPEPLRERIFDAAFSTRTRGSGLGLANARRFVEAHGGRVRAGARADGRPGLLLTVELPVGGPRSPS